jgi:hypothetical protein
VISELVSKPAERRLDCGHARSPSRCLPS